MKLLDQHQKFMLRKALVELDMQVEKRQYLSVEELHMVQKENQITKKEN